MTIRSYLFFNLLALALSSKTDNPEVSSIYKGSSESLFAASVNRPHSSSCKDPLLSLDASIIASNPNNLMPSWSLDISSENTATPNLSPSAALYAIFKASDVLPMLGLPAIMIRSEG